MLSTSSALERSSLLEKIRQFFHAQETPYALALVRIFLPLSLLMAIVPRWSRARELFSADGATTPIWAGYGYTDLLPEPSGTLAVIMASVLVLTLVTMAIGWCTRLSVPIVFLLYTYLNCLDAASTMTKYSVVATHVFLLLSFSECGLVWSVDAWLKRRKTGRTPLPIPAHGAPKASVWPRRLIQLLIGYVYFGAAMTKLHMPSYFSGDQLVTWFRSNVNYANPLGEYLSLFPALVVLCAYITVIWEILFVFLAWRGWGRTCMVGLGVVFHVMTAFTLGLIVFPAVCLSVYLAFLNEDDIRRMALKVHHWKRRFFGQRKKVNTRVSRQPLFGALNSIPLPAPAAFVVLLTLVAFLGVEAEYRLDPYGKRRPEGPYTLKELDARYVEQVLLAQSGPIRYKDMVAHFDAGTVIIGGQLANPKRDFHHGEILQAQCWLNAPHKDINLECELKDAEGYTVLTKSRLAIREWQRVFMKFPITDALEPGEYSLHLKCAGVPVMSRSIRIHGRNGSGSAN